MGERINLGIVVMLLVLALVWRAWPTEAQPPYRIYLPEVTDTDKLPAHPLPPVFRPPTLPPGEPPKPLNPPAGVPFPTLVPLPTPTPFA